MAPLAFAQLTFANEINCYISVEKIKGSNQFDKFLTSQKLEEKSYSFVLTPDDVIIPLGEQPISQSGSDLSGAPDSIMNLIKKNNTTLVFLKYNNDELSVGSYKPVIKNNNFMGKDMVYSVSSLKNQSVLLMNGLAVICK